MITNEVDKASEVSSYIGVPVLLQLRRPLIIPEIAETQALPHAGVKTRQWIPTEARGEDNLAEATEFIRYAVIVGFVVGFDRKIDDLQLMRVQWLAPSQAGPVVVETLIPLEDIAGVTRIVSPPPLPEEPKLIKI